MDSVKELLVISFVIGQLGSFSSLGDAPNQGQTDSSETLGKYESSVEAPEGAKFARSSPPPVTPILGPVVISADENPTTAGIWGHRLATEAGHGRTWRNTDWRWQRVDWFPGSHVHSSQEDFNTARMVNRWLLPYLRSAGAIVYTDRCDDEQTNEIICDISDVNTSYSVSGNWLSSPRYDAYGGFYSYADSTSDTTATASAELRTTITQSGYYGVTIWYPGVSSATRDALFTVIDGAGYRHSYLVDQARDSGRWILLGRHYFDAGTDVLIMEVSNKSKNPDGRVMLDCVRLGGGMGSVEFGGGVSGAPRWQEAAVCWTKYNGAPEWVWSASIGEGNDSLARFNNAAYNQAEALIRLHTNGSDYHTGFGSEVYQTSPSSDGLTALGYIYPKIIQSIRNHYRSNWTDRGVKANNTSGWPFDYINVEIGFHDWLTDAQAMMDADFRRVAMRGYYEGIVDYLTNKTGIYLPEPPESISVKNIGESMVRAEWTTATIGSLPDSYRVYYSTHPYCYKDYVSVTSSSLSADIGPLIPGKLYYLQMRAINGGGLSFPSETLTAMVSAQTDAKAILIVNGYDRFDWDVDETDNKRNYCVQHAVAIADAATSLGLGISIDSAANEAAVSNFFSYASYSIIDWILGQEGNADDSFTYQEQEKIADYHDYGTGVLIVSGSDVATDLGTNGTVDDQLFLKNYLHATYIGRITAPTAFDANSGGVFDGLNLTLNTGEDIYAVLQADEIDGFSASPVYSFEGTSSTAAVHIQNNDDTIFYFAFPIEAIGGADNRRALMERILPFAPERSVVSMWELY